MGWPFAVWALGEEEMRHLMAFVVLAFAAPYAFAADDANCRACVSSYHCEGYQETCAKNCETKAETDAAARAACVTACGTAASDCVTKGTAGCSDYCK
jgi:hypothetical protein